VASDVWRIYHGNWQVAAGVDWLLEGAE